MAKRKLKFLLQSMDKPMLIAFILEMYDTRKEIAAYLDYYVHPDEKAQFAKAKKIIENEYFELGICLINHFMRERFGTNEFVQQVIEDASLHRSAVETVAIFVDVGLQVVGVAVHSPQPTLKTHYHAVHFGEIPPFFAR